MNTPSPDNSRGITSALVDLDEVSLAELRVLDSAELHRSLHHVMDAAGHPRMAAGNSSSMGIVD
jgi:hypothetical protein